MASTILSDELDRAEGLLIQGEDEAALELLARLAEDVEEYVDKNCPAEEGVQYFSFPTLFERLCYRRVERDPRELIDVGEPFDRLYSDLALAHVRAGDYDAAIEALKLACRWNPMECGFRLDLADLFRACGNMDEYLGLTYSVFERASDARHLVRAFTNFAGWFEVSEKLRTAAAALRAARAFDMPDSRLEAALELAKGTDRDPDLLSDEEAAELLAEEGLEFGANAEVAICLIMCAADAAEMGDRYTATELTIRARDLVGEKQAMALLAFIREQGGAADGEDE